MLERRGERTRQEERGEEKKGKWNRRRQGRRGRKRRAKKEDEEEEVKFSSTLVYSLRLLHGKWRGFISLQCSKLDFEALLTATRQ